MKNAASIFILAAVIGVAEKYLAALVSGAVEAFSISRELGEKMADSGVELDLAIIYAETEKASFPPTRWITRRVIRKAVKGDLVASGRFFSRCSQVQGFLVLVESVLVLLATCLLVGGLNDIVA